MLLVLPVVLVLVLVLTVIISEFTLLECNSY
jgi:hypothetical protein